MSWIFRHGLVCLNSLHQKKKKKLHSPSVISLFKQFQPACEFSAELRRHDPELTAHMDFIIFYCRGAKAERNLNVSQFISEHVLHVLIL